MNVWLVAKRFVGAASVSAAAIALLARLRADSLVRTGANVDAASAVRRHRLAGWIAVAGFALDVSLSALTERYPGFTVGPWYLHGALGLPCAVAVVRRVWAAQHAAAWHAERLLAWRLAVFVAGASFTLLTCALALWRHAGSAAGPSGPEIPLRQAAGLAHAGLAISLAGLGRYALQHRPVVTI